MFMARPGAERGRERAGSSKKQDVNGKNNVNNVNNETNDHKHAHGKRTNGMQEWRAAPPDRLRLQTAWWSAGTRFDFGFATPA